MGFAEEEIFGNVYDNGVPITATGYYVTLDKLAGGLPSGGSTSQMWVNPAKYQGGWMYGWYDTNLTEVDGPCREPRGPEVHRVWQEVPPSGTEEHCVSAGGRYRFTLWDGDPGSGTIVQRYELDYVAAEYSIDVVNQMVPPGSFGRTETMEAVSGGEPSDAYVSVDLIDNAAGTSWSGWTPYTTDSDYDFQGHNYPGTQKVQVEVLRIGDGAQDVATQTFSVTDAIISVTGQTAIQYKSTYTYNSNVIAYWFEQYPPDPAWDQKFSTASNKISRIWPAGEYEVVLRHEGSGSPLRRADLHITVCTTTGSCIGGAQSLALEGSSSAQSLPVATFGAGPIISNGPTEAVSFYNLAGAHSADSWFTGRDWMDGGSGTLGEQGSGAELSWDGQRIDASRVALAFSGLSGNARGAVFGFAWDPDVGSYAHDDRSGYDTVLGLLYAYDAEEAAGVLLRQNGRDALASAMQYGARRLAPMAAAGVAAAIRSGDGEFDLLPESDDVQFLLSAGEIEGTAAIRVHLLKASTVQALRAAAQRIVEEAG